MDQLFETSDEPTLVAAYARQGVTLDALPYTAAFEAVYDEVRGGGLKGTRAEVFHRLHNLRKAGRLPRLGRAAHSVPRLEPAHEALLVRLVEAEVGELSKRDRLVFTPAFDAVVQAFNDEAAMELSAHDAWRVVSKLAKRPRAEGGGSAGGSARGGRPRSAAYPLDTPPAEHVGEAFVAASRQTLGAAMHRVRHAVGQLNDAQVWQRLGDPAARLNSVGNLLLHLAGNLGQWVVAGVPGDAPARDRASEFGADAGAGLDRDALLAELQAVVDQCLATLDGLADAGDDALLARRTIQGFDTDVLHAVYHAVGHFEGHTQEVVCLTRQMLGERYVFAWTPGAGQG